MRKELKVKLDQELKISKRRQILLLLLVSSGFIGFVLVFIPFFPSSSTNIQGVAVKLTSVQTDAGNFPKMMVQLENNGTVRASMPRNLKFIKGAKVNVLKTKSIMGVPSYKVLGYAKPNT